MNPRNFFILNSAFNQQLADSQIELYFSNFSLLSKVIPNSLTEFFDLMSKSMIKIVKSSRTVFFLFDTNIARNFFGFAIIRFTLSQFVVVWDSSRSISISELRSDEYADKVLSSVKLWSDAFVMNKHKSFRKMLKRPPELILVAHLK